MKKHGVLATKKGDKGEKLFEEYCLKCKISCIRIQNPVHFSKPQICDYILVYKGVVWLVDVKFLDTKNIVSSHFFKLNRVKTLSTHKQSERFLGLLKSHKFTRSGFFILESFKGRGELKKYFLPVSRLKWFEVDPTLKLRTALIPIEPSTNIFKVLGG